MEDFIPLVPLLLPPLHQNFKLSSFSPPFWPFFSTLICIMVFISCTSSVTTTYKEDVGALDCVLAAPCNLPDLLVVGVCVSIASVEEDGCVVSFGGMPHYFYSHSLFFSYFFLGIFLMDLIHNLLIHPKSLCIWVFWFTKYFFGVSIHLFF